MSARPPVAIIGMSARLPGAPGTRPYWELLRSGASGISDVPADRWTADEPGTHRGGFLTDVAGFDAGFFGISPREAAAMDPQQRLALELAWEAFEDAGLLPAHARGGPIGVFVGAIREDYAAVTRAHRPQDAGPHTMTGLSRGMIANRISYAFGLCGPSLTVDSAQSSSLVAVHLACESLGRGESELALAGGVTLNLVAESAIDAARFGGLSPDGECFTFDERANGFVRGEGGGLVLLKPLDRALADGDPVYCVIRGGAVNNDGATDTLTTPSTTAQADLLRQAHRQAGVDPGEVQYVELHGTGTRLGDPIEAAALGAVFGPSRPATDPLPVGSAKTAVGHLEGAAGITGLLRTALAIAHRELPGNPTFRRPHPAIRLDTLNLRVPTVTGAWPHQDRPLIAGVSSFGMGGTNCHLVLAEHVTASPPPAGAAAEPPPAPWLISGRTAQALAEQADRLRAVHGAHRPADVAFSLATTRTRFEHRAAVTATGGAELAAGLAALAEGRPHPAVVRGTVRPGGVVLLFSGQGSQRAGMGAGLYRRFPRFAAALDEVLAGFAGPFGDSLRTALFAGPGSAEAALLDETAYTQAGLFAVEVALHRLIEHWGVRPAVLLGHSVGELAAAHVAGVLSLPDACALVAARGRLMATLPRGGAMAALEATETEAAAALTGREHEVVLAAINGPRAVVVSGDEDAVGDMMARFRDLGRRTRRLRVSHAFHSPRMEPILGEFRAVAESLTYHEPVLPLVSNVTGELTTGVHTDPEYWVRHARHPVRFADGLRSAAGTDVSAHLEIGPGGALTAMGPACVADGVFVPALRGDRPEAEALLAALARLDCAGIGVDWPAVLAGTGARRVPLPTYPFQRTRHWLDGEARDRVAPPEPAVDPLWLVRAHTAAVLGHAGPEAVDPALPFRDLGLDSVLAVELRDALNTATGAALGTTALFDHPTPAALAARLGAHRPDEWPGQDTGPAPADPHEPIAIVAMGCRYPGGVSTPEQLWTLVADGVDATSAFPDDRGWDLAELAGSASGSATSRGAFVSGAGDFDAAFFGISPREALAMDPQQRLLLEIVWEVVERAGLDPSALRGSRTGVFVGAMAQDYGPRLHEATEEVGGYLLTGTSSSLASGRISYAFGLQGPSLTVDTACSASLVALHLAVQALRTGECELALAGGAAVLAGPGMFVEFSRQQGLSPDGRCKAFAAAADGTGWGEGAGLLLVERLSDARRHGHRVLALIRGSAVNSDGASNGLTAPNGASQQRVIRQALANSGLTPADVDAVEAHGTGTRLGDPIEAEALLATYGRGRDERRPLWLGSLKSNIGHTQAAAGVGGVIKMTLALQNGLLPRTLHVDEPSSYVDWTAGAVALLTEAARWPETGRPRRAAVSSFGISGANAHLILEQAPPEPPAPTPSGEPEPPATVPWVLSARSGEALRGQAARLVAETAGERALDVGFSLATTRFPLEHRVVAFAEAGRIPPALTALAAGGEPGGLVGGVAASVGRIAFVFPGQGAQWAGMGRALLASAPVFAERLRDCERALGTYVDWSLTGVLTGAPGAPALDRVDVVQPVSWAVLVSLAELWRSHGVEPAAVVGHSQGEIAAAVVAGGLSLEDGARVVALRSQAIVALAGHGAMVSVRLPAPAVREMISRWDGRLSLAAVNGSASAVVSGVPDAVDELVAGCAADGVHARRIPVDYASHSAQVERIADTLAAALAPVEPRPSAIPFYSSVTGDRIDTTELDAGYWYRNLRSTVEFARATETLLAAGHDVFVEVSPHPVLTVAIQETAEDNGRPATVLATLRRNEGGPERFLTALAEAWTAGVPVRWETAFAGSGARRVDLPTYAFQRRRFWLGQHTRPTDPAGFGQTGAGHPLLGARIELAEDGGTLWTGTVSVRTHPWLADHAVHGTVLLPGTALLDLAATAGEHAGCPRVDDLLLQAPLPLGEAVQLQVAVEAPDDAGRRGVTVHSRPAAGGGSGWTRHAVGTLVPAGDHPSEEPVAWPPPDAHPVDVSSLYAALAAKSYQYGPAFQGVRAAWRRGSEVFAELELPTTGDGFVLHPALLDAALHAIGLGTLETMWDGNLPFSFAGAERFAGGATSARVWLRPAGDNAVTVLLRDAAGCLLAVIERLEVRRFAPQDLGSDPARQHLYEVEWPAIPAPDTVAPDAGSTILRCPSPAGETAAAARETTERVLAELQDRIEHDRPGVLAVVTRRAIATESGEDVPNLASAPVWGLVRAAQSEHPGRFVLVDSDDGPGAGALLPAAIASGEPQLAIRGAEIRAPRLARAGRPELSPPAGAAAWRLDVTSKGTLENLALVEHPAALAPLAAGEVRVAVRAAGLNFRDVVLALGMVDQDVPGNEGAGVVVETGPGVSRFAPGDRVLGMIDGAFGPFAVTREDLLAPIPGDWSFERAASVPTVYLTAYYALIDLARVRPGDRVLVHAAAGGVGMAAVQLARHLGAEVYATASRGKWDVVRASGIDDAHLADSRTLDFAPQFLAATGGEGMDVVLDSLAREFVDASLRLLPGGGRFIEMGKTDIRDAALVAEACPGVRYRAFDLVEAGPKRLGAMLAEILELFASGALQPIPVRRWDVRRAPEAFRFLGRAQHVGKIVLTVPAPIDPAGTVLITGGTGTLGALIARHLVTAHGIRRLLLAGRRGADAPGATEIVAGLTALGATASVVALDAADRPALARVLAGIAADHPLTAVVHAAGVLDDSVLGALDPGRLARVSRPKIDAAVNLHELTAHLPLAAFVVFSSVTATVGTQGQANYTAANAFLDALAAHRRARGLPAQALAWGPWAERSGMTGHLTDADVARMRRSGLALLPTDEGLALFDAALVSDHAHLVPARLVAPAGATMPPLLSAVLGTSPHRPPAAARPAAAAVPDLAARLTSADPGDRAEIVLDVVRTHAATVLGHDGPASIGPGEAFKDLGFDSLTAVELRNRLGAATGARLRTTVTFDYPTPVALAGHLRTLLLPGEDAAAPPAVPPLDALESALGEVSGDAGVRARVAERLRTLLWQWSGDQNGATGPAPAGDPELASASDDEIFDLIDNELGI